MAKKTSRVGLGDNTESRRESEKACESFCAEGVRDAEEESRVLRSDGYVLRLDFYSVLGYV